MSSVMDIGVEERPSQSDSTGREDWGEATLTSVKTVVLLDKDYMACDNCFLTYCRCFILQERIFCFN